MIWLHTVSLPACIPECLLDECHATHQRDSPPHDSMFHFLCHEHIFTFLPGRHYPQTFSGKVYNYLLIFRFKKITLISLTKILDWQSIDLLIVPRLHLTEFVISCFSHLDLLSGWEITVEKVHNLLIFFNPVFSIHIEHRWSMSIH